MALPAASAPAALDAGDAASGRRNLLGAKASGVADVRRRRHRRASADILDAGRGPAHPRLAAPRRRRGGRRRGRRADAVRRSPRRGQGRVRVDRPGSGRHPQRGAARSDQGPRRCHRADGRHLPRRVHRPRPLRCAGRARPGRQRRHQRAVRETGCRTGRVGCPRGRAQRHDGRPGGGHPRRAGRRRPHRRRHPGLRRQVRVGVLRSVPRGRRVEPVRGTGAPTSRTPATRARRCARSNSTSPRAPTS